MVDNKKDFMDALCNKEKIIEVGGTCVRTLSGYFCIPLFFKISVIVFTILSIISFILHAYFMAWGIVFGSVFIICSVFGCALLVYVLYFDFPTLIELRKYKYKYDHDRKIFILSRKDSI